MRKTFYALLMIAALIFAVMSIGGCGGSNRSNPGRSSESESKEEKSTELAFTGKMSGDLLPIYGNDKYDKMMEELKA